MLVNDKYKNVSDDQMLQMVKELAIKLGRTPKAKETGKKYGIPSLPTYLSRFKTKSWNDILELCDIGINQIANITVEEGKQRLYEFYNKLGRLPKQNDFKKYNWYPSPTWYTRHFGGLENALIELGLKEKPLSNEERKKITINELKDIADKLNRCPKQEEYDSLRTEGFSLCMLRRKFNMTFSEICNYYLDEKYFSIIDEGYKICSICGEKKLLNEFHLDGSKRRSDCRVCSYLKRNKNIIIAEGWTLEEYKIIIDSILNNKIEYINDLTKIINNKTLDDFIYLLSNNLKIGSFDNLKRVKKNCVICNKEFELTVGLANRIKCCSKECGLELKKINNKIRREKNNIKVNCDYCGKPLSLTKSRFEESEKHFCNRECHAEYLKSTHREVRYCEVCGEPFVTLKTKDQKYCSVPCSRIAYSQIYVGENHWAYNRIKTNCTWCNKDLTIDQCNNKRSKHHFCNKDCFRQWFANVCSQTEEFKNRSRQNTLRMLSDGTINTTKTSIQIKTNDILDKLKIQFKNEEIYDYYAVDNYLTKYNLIIEVQGDYFHCNPLIYNEINYEMQLGRIYNDRTKNKYLKNQYQINILYLWGKDISERPDVCEKLILEYINKNGDLKNYNSFNYDIDQNNTLYLKNEIIKSYIEYPKKELDNFVNLKVTNGRYIRKRDESKWMKYNCDQCGEECESLISRYNQTKNHFCCKECYDKFQNKHEIRICDNCGKEISVLPNRVKNNKHIYCSKNCEFEFKRKNKNKNSKNT